MPDYKPIACAVWVFQPRLPQPCERQCDSGAYWWPPLPELRCTTCLITEPPDYSMLACLSFTSISRRRQVDLCPRLTPSLLAFQLFDFLAAGEWSAADGCYTAETGAEVRDTGGVCGSPCTPCNNHVGL